jgi:hypothetical protein
VRERQLPREQSRDEDEQVVQPSCPRERKTHRRIEAQGVDQDKAAFLNAQRAGYKKRGAAERLINDSNTTVSAILICEPRK